MEDTASDAVLALEKLATRIHRDAHEHAAELQRVTNILCPSWGLPTIDRASFTGPLLVPATKEEGVKPKSASSRVHSGQFRGMKPTTALEVYMRARRDDGHIPIANVLVDLLAGGLDMGKRGDYWERRIMAAARQRPIVFGLDMDRREMWLKPSALEAPKLKRRGAGKKLPPDSGGTRQAG